MTSTRFHGYQEVNIVTLLSKSHKFDNIDEMDQFPKRYTLIKLTNDNSNDNYLVNKSNQQLMTFQNRTA